MKPFLTAIVLTTVLGCGATQYRDPALDKGSREWGAREIKTTVNTMVASLYQALKDRHEGVFIEVKKIRNKTGEHIDAKILSDEIVTQLLRRRITFIDRTYTADAVREMERGMTGLVDQESAISTGGLVSPNYYLYGEIRENLQYPGNKQKQYIVVTLTLTSLKTGVVQWQEQQDFYKISAKTRISH
jgi:PBP1b-binding outer membrane lipoprotein LpoB